LNAAGSLVWAAFKPGAGDWERAVNLSEPGNYSTAVQMAMRPGGTAVALWNENGQGRLALRSTVTGTWSQQAPFDVYTVGSLVADGVGDVIATWQSDNVMVSELPAGTDTWQPPVAIPSSQPAVNGFTIGFDGQRGLVAVWARSDTYDQGMLMASRRPAGASGWESPVTLGNLTGFFWNAQSTTDLDGDAIIAFETSNGASVQTAILDSAVPRLKSLSFHQTGRVGRRLPFGAEPVDISPVKLKWSFGDGRTATGANVTHAYRKAGRYRVDLVATDAAGHSALVSRSSVRILR
jgi:hypothetical protein